MLTTYSHSPVEDGGGEPGSEVVGSAEQISLGWSAIFWQVLHIHQNVWPITGEGTWRLKGHLWDLRSQWSSVPLYALTDLSRKAVVRGLSGTGLVWAGWWGMRFTSVGLKTSAKTWERCEALLHWVCISTLRHSAQGNAPTKHGLRLKEIEKKYICTVCVCVCVWRTHTHY